MPVSNIELFWFYWLMVQNVSVIPVKREKKAISEKVFSLFRKFSNGRHPLFDSSPK